MDTFFNFMCLTKTNMKGKRDKDVFSSTLLYKVIKGKSKMKKYIS